MIGRETEPTPPTRGRRVPARRSISSRPIFGVIGLLAAAQFAGGPYCSRRRGSSSARRSSASVSDAMLLGHWYLVQPGLRRDPVKELVRWTAIVWPFEWSCSCGRPAWCRCSTARSTTATTACSAGSGSRARSTTIGLVGMTWVALKERYYSAVMAATGLLYLAILTAFGTDLIARAVLKP